LLKDRGVEFGYRDYRSAPLSAGELRLLLGKLGVRANTLLRRNDPAFKQLGLDGSEPDGVLLPLLAKHPTLLQRPIGVRGDRAVVGRPPERLLDLLS